MLFVDHHDPEATELDVGLEQRVGSYDDLGLARCETLPLAPAIAGFERAGKNPQAVVGTALVEQPPEVPVVLLGQDLGRRHQRRLVAVVHRNQQRQKRDDRLSRADVPLQQAVHAMGRAQVLTDLGEDPLLRPGKLERQQPRESRAQRIGDLVRDAATLLAEVLALEGQRQLQKEDLLERE